MSGGTNEPVVSDDRFERRSKGFWSQAGLAILGSAVALGGSLITVGLTADRTQSDTLREQSVERRAKVYSDFLTNVTAFQVSVAHCEEPMHQGLKGDPASCDKARTDFTQAAGSAWAVDFASSGGEVRDAKNKISEKMNSAYVNVEAVYVHADGATLNDATFQSFDQDLKDLKKNFSDAASQDLGRASP